MSDSRKETWTLDDLRVLAAECAEDGLTSADEAIEWAAARIARLEDLLADSRWALRVTWDQLSPDEDAEINNGPEFGMETINVRTETLASILEWFDTDEEADRFDQTLWEALDE